MIQLTPLSPMLLSFRPCRDKNVWSQRSIIEMCSAKKNGVLHWPCKDARWPNILGRWPHLCPTRLYSTEKKKWRFSRCNFFSRFLVDFFSRCVLVDNTEPNLQRCLPLSLCSWMHWLYRDKHMFFFFKTPSQRLLIFLLYWSCFQDGNLAHIWCRFGKLGSL